MPENSNEREATWNLWNKKCFVFVQLPQSVEMAKIWFTCKKLPKITHDESVRLTWNVKIKVQILASFENQCNLKLNSRLWRDLQNNINSDCSADKKIAFHYFFTAWFKYSLESSMFRIYHVHGKFSFSWLVLITIIYITFSSTKREKMHCLLVTSYLLTFRSIDVSALWDSMVNNYTSVLITWSCIIKW